MSQTNQLATRPQNAPVPRLSREELLALFDTPEELRDVRRAIVLSTTPGMVPDTMVGNPSAVLSAFWVCDALGVERNPINFKQIYSVHGRPDIMAQLQLGLAHRAGFKSRWIEQTDEVSTIELDGQQFSFTIEQARKAGLTNSDTYKRYPMDMLGWKAVARAVRKVCPEVLLGLQATAPQLLASPIAPVDEETDEIEDAEIVTEDGEIIEASAATVIPDAPAETSTAGEGAATPASDETVAADLFAETYADTQIPVAKAKQELVKAASDAGLPDDEAKLMASVVWAEYFAKTSPETVAHKTLDIMVDDIKGRVAAS